MNIPSIIPTYHPMIIPIQPYQTPLNHTQKSHRFRASRTIPKPSPKGEPDHEKWAEIAAIAMRKTPTRKVPPNLGAELVVALGEMSALFSSCRFMAIFMVIHSAHYGDLC